jgi:hypothetical protein
MTPKEKAKELIEMFIFFASNEGTTEDGFIYSDEMQMFNAKQCALIAVDEMLGLGAIVGSDLSDSFYIYWEEVKQEIKNL